MNACIASYIYKQIHKEKKFQKILYTFIETYFRNNDNAYGRPILLQRHTYRWQGVKTSHISKMHNVQETQNNVSKQTRNRVFATSICAILIDFAFEF